MRSAPSPFTDPQQVSEPLYASAERVISEITRCLAPDGTLIIAVKSADSYRELDQAVAASGVDLDGPVQVGQGLLVAARKL